MLLIELTMNQVMMMVQLVEDLFLRMSLELHIDERQDLDMDDRYLCRYQHSFESIDRYSLEMTDILAILMINRMDRVYHPENWKKHKNQSITIQLIKSLTLIYPVQNAFLANALTTKSNNRTDFFHCASSLVFFPAKSMKQIVAMKPSFFYETT